MIGWSENFEGGLAQTATVMSWLGEESAVAAAHSGHDADLTPQEKSYFDKSQGDFYNEPPSWRQMVDIKTVYNYVYTPENLQKGKEKHIIGGQACLWTERVESESHLQYMLYPRLRYTGKEINETHTYKKPFSPKMPVLICSGIKHEGKNYKANRFIATDFINPSQITLVKVSSKAYDNLKGENAIDLGGSEHEYNIGNA